MLRWPTPPKVEYYLKNLTPVALLHIVHHQTYCAVPGRAVARGGGEGQWRGELVRYVQGRRGDDDNRKLFERIDDSAYDSACDSAYDRTVLTEYDSAYDSAYFMTSASHHSPSPTSCSRAASRAFSLKRSSITA